MPMDHFDPKLCMQNMGNPFTLTAIGNPKRD